MGTRIIDVVVTTRNRLDYLTQTLDHIIERTRSPYALHVIDDASDGGNVDYLMGLWREGRIHSLLLRSERCGAMANLNTGAWMSFSNPVVFTDDDVLCPDVEPDWLARGLAVMDKYKDIGLLALNHPGARRRIVEKLDDVVICRFVGGTFMFVRRAFLKENWLPHYRENFGITPTTQRCHRAAKAGYKVAYLPDTYCQHIGHESVLTGRNYGGRFVEVGDPVTLEPTVERWRN